MRTFGKISVFIAVFVFALGLAMQSKAATAVDLGAAADFGVLAGSGITNTGSTVINGDVGSFPTVTTGGFPPGIINGTNHGGDAVTQQAKIDLVTAYNAAAGQTAVTVPTELGGTTKTAGVYDSAAGTFQITGTLTLDAQGDPNAVFIFKTATTLITAGASNINLINGAQARNVFWQVGSSATLGGTTAFKGTILALTSISLTTSATVEGRLLARDGAVTLDTNTITVPATLQVVKVVVGGTKTIADFPLFVNGSPVTSSVVNTFPAGTYTVTETADPNYTRTFSGACNSSGSVTLVAGNNLTCTITNTYVPPAPPLPATLQVIKRVVNNSGGTATSSDFNLHVKLLGVEVTGSPAVGVVDPGRTYTLAAGTYVVSEDANASYVRSFSGACDIGGSVTLAPGLDYTCVVTNDDIIAPPVPTSTITVIKTVVGGTKTIADFPLFVNGTPVSSSMPYVFASSALYTVTEITNSNYTRTFGGHCNVNGQLSLAPGEAKVCTVLNTYVAPSSGSGTYVTPVPPIITVLKVPSPLALPDGAGSVTYTYTLKNVGTVPVTNITMVDDSCSSITYDSGDTNSDSRLDLTETWIYKCIMTVSLTHMNTVVATGWANGLSATDIAHATVVVGTSIVPPLINVTKVPSPLTLPAGGGFVTYTNKVTNPGTVPLSNVRLTDDRCSPVNYVSGDSNGNSLLDTTETWTYTCRSNLTQTTINTITASGDANGLTARDYAIVTVVVAAASATTTVPKLPDTGSPFAGMNLWNIVMIAGIIMLASISLIIFLRKFTV